MDSVFYSSVGGRHLSRGQPCDDRSAALYKNGVYSIAVADGAGSAKYDCSAQGAECVVSTVTEFFCNNFEKFYSEDDTEKLANVLIMICRDSLNKRAKELGIDSINRMASTLLSVAVKDGKVIVCHLGDGVIGRLDPEGVNVITAPDNGEYAGTTFFVTTPGAASHLRILKDRSGDTFSYFLMTDGAADYLLEDDGKLSPAAEKMALLPSKEDGQKQLERVIKERMIDADPCSDDCSYACLYLGSKPGMQYEPPQAPCDVQKKDTPIRTDERKRPDRSRKYVTGIIVVVLSGAVFLSAAFLFPKPKPENNGGTTNSLVSEKPSTADDNANVRELSREYTTPNDERNALSESTIYRTVSETTESISQEEETNPSFGTSRSGNSHRISGQQE